MEDSNETTASLWRRPLKGWRWLAAWIGLLAGLAAIVRTVLSLTTDTFSGVAAASSWLFSVGIALAAIILIWLLVRCLSSWRNFKRLLLGLACLAGLIALFYVEEDVRGKLVWQRFQAQCAAKGEMLDFAAFIPPSVPDDRNFAMTPVVASTYGQILDRDGHRINPPNTNVVNRLEMPLEIANGGPTNGFGNWQKVQPSNLEAWQHYYRKLSPTTNLFPVAPQPQTPAADVLLALSRYDSTIEELRRAAALPASRFPLNYDNEETFSILLPHLAPLKGCAQVLRLHALAELEVVQSDAALADISLALRLIDKIRSEPFLISHLVRMAMLQIAVQPIWEGLARHRWSDAELTELERQLATFDFVADYQAAMRGENACEVAGLEFLRRHPAQLERIGEFGERDSACVAGLPGPLVPSGWFYQNERRCAEFILGQFVPIADPGRKTISPRLVKQAQDSLEAMRRTPYTTLCKTLLLPLEQSARKFAFAQAAVNLARTACASERYRLAHGKYPETLDPLAPQFIVQVPHDPISGQALRYRLTEDRQFILYSVGWNQRDDGGTLAVTKNGVVDLDTGDWVWRYPSSPKT